MKTAGRKDPNRWAKHVQRPSTWCGRSKQILLIHGGCEARKIAAMGEIFFLTSTFIEQTRTYKRLQVKSVRVSFRAMLSHVEVVRFWPGPKRLGRASAPLPSA